jgi:hypothetical protein
MPRYREWAWELFEYFDQTERVENGYAGLTSVQSSNQPKDNRMQVLVMGPTSRPGEECCCTTQYSQHSIGAIKARRSQPQRTARNARQYNADGPRCIERNIKPLPNSVFDTVRFRRFRLKAQGYY